MSAFLGVITSFLAFLIGYKIYKGYLKTGELPVRHFAFKFFSMAITLFLLIFPVLIKQPFLGAYTLPLSVFFMFLGLAFYFNVLLAFTSSLTQFKDFIFPVTLIIGMTTALLTFFQNPSLEIDDFGWVTYKLPLFLKIIYLLAISFMVGIVTSSLFLMRSLRFETKAITIKALLMALGMFLFGLAVLFIIFEDNFFYNFLFFFAFIAFYFETVIKIK